MDRICFKIEWAVYLRCLHYGFVLNSTRTWSNVHSRRCSISCLDIQSWWLTVSDADKLIKSWINYTINNWHCQKLTACVWEVVVGNIATKRNINIIFYMSSRNLRGKRWFRLHPNITMIIITFFIFVSGNSHAEQALCMHYFRAPLHRCVLLGGF